jgi:crotonobetainyl-CoA:carnitine CoA-transferase CaiB-like acyl-CoA transferase
MTKILEGIRVLEVSQWAYVPSAGAVLADWGADVIKIEHPETGDPIRGLTIAGIGPNAAGVPFMFEIFNRGKRSVGVNIGTERGLEVLMRLVDRADVFLTSFLPGARARLGIDADQVMARNPRIVYARGSGQGPAGEEADKGGFDALSYWYRGGIASAVTPDTEEYPLGMPGGAFGDNQSGMMLAGGIAAALFHRERTGNGVVVDGSLLASSLWAMQPSIAGSAILGMPEFPKQGRVTRGNPLVGTYRTSDGRFVALCMLEADKYWPGLCEALDRQDLLTDPRFDGMLQRATNWDACIAELDAAFGAHPLEHWQGALARQDGQWSVVQKVGELASDQQAIANRYIQDVNYPTGVSLPMVASPIQFAQSAPDLGLPPQHGEHTDEVLGEIGFDWDTIVELKVEGAVL